MNLQSAILTCLLCVVLQSTYISAIRLDVNPHVIVSGVTPELDLNCSMPFNTSARQNMKVLSSLHISISRHNKTHGYETITSQDNFGYSNTRDNNSHSVGAISQTGNSYLSVQIFRPTKNQQAWYNCEAFGFNSKGLPRHFTSQPKYVTLRVSQTSVIVPNTSVTTTSATTTSVTTTSATTTLATTTPVTTTPAPLTILSTTTTTPVVPTSPEDKQTGLKLKTSSDFLVVGISIEMFINCTLPTLTQHQAFAGASSFNLTIFHKPLHKNTFQGVLTSYDFYNRRHIKINKIQELDTNTSFSRSYGSLNENNTSFLTAQTYNYDLTDNIGGSYHCQASGIDTIGRSIILQSPVVEVKPLHPTEQPGLDLHLTPATIYNNTKEFSLNCIFQTSNTSTSNKVQSITIFIKIGSHNFSFYVHSDINHKPHVYYHYIDKYYTDLLVTDDQLSFLHARVRIVHIEYFKQEKVEYKCKSLVLDSNGDYSVVTSPTLRLNVTDIIQP